MKQTFKQYVEQLSEDRSKFNNEMRTKIGIQDKFEGYLKEIGNKQYQPNGDVYEEVMAYMNVLERAYRDYQNMIPTYNFEDPYKIYIKCTENGKNVIKVIKKSTLANVEYDEAHTKQFISKYVKDKDALKNIFNQLSKGKQNHTLGGVRINIKDYNFLSYKLLSHVNIDKYKL